MPNFTVELPLALYVHIPWCVKKCPYCDFNSHAMKTGAQLPEQDYVASLLSDLDQHASLIADRKLISIFFGGGTPSLLSGTAMMEILSGIQKRVQIADNCEITLEANPGTIDAAHFAAYKAAGINRLSLGVQSLQNDKLKALGRIHDKETALAAIETIASVGFTNFNIDLMFALPKQTIDEAMHDLNEALTYQPAHLSWYQLTIEPNTLFAKKTPQHLPHDDVAFEMQSQGQALLQANGYGQYEVSAYATANRQCQHNLNYWQFGDYLGIGAGAHSKMTDHEAGYVQRFSQVRHPRDYLQAKKRIIKEKKIIAEKDLIFEFMLNAMRLSAGFSVQQFSERTGLTFEAISATIAKAVAKGLVVYDDEKIVPTPLGKKFLNNLMMMFLL